MQPRLKSLTGLLKFNIIGPIASYSASLDDAISFEKELLEYHSNLIKLSDK